MRIKVAIIIGILMLLAITTSAQAAVLTVDGGWTEFTFGNVGSSWSDFFDFTLFGPGILTVTDRFNSGDRFNVTDFGASLGDTSLPTTLGDFTTDFDLAASDPRWSTGVFNLSAGNYRISGTVILSPYLTGGAGLKVDSTSGVVPEPASLSLLGLGLLGVIGIRNKRKA